MLIFLSILYAISVIICFFLLREVVKRENFDESDELILLVVMMMCPVANIFFCISQYLDAKNIEIDFEYIIKKIFFVKDGE